MTLLPVVERELRVAARERSTYRVRFLAALLPVLFCGFSLWFVTLMGGRPFPPRELFMVLTWIGFIFVSIAGFCLTADTISEEKRDATLGLLFLTDLKGYDIVTGKLTGAGVRGLYALFATMPVLAIPLMMGGTSAAEFARTSLVLFMTLLFSMAVGLFCSAVAKKAWAALGMSFAVVIFFAAVLPLLGIFLQQAYWNHKAAFYLQVPSPSYALIMSFDWAWMMPSNSFGYSAGLLLGYIFGFVLLSALITPRVWQDRPPRKWLAGVLQWRRDFIYGSRAFRQDFRRRLLEMNPLYWLARRERVSSLGFLMIVLGCGGAVWWASEKAKTVPNPEAELIIPWVAWIVCASVVHLLLALRIAVIAAERFGDDRRSGALELLLSTSLSVKEIVRGHWQALRRQFTGPALAAWFIHLQPIFWLIMLQPILSRQERNRGFLELAGEIFAHFFLGDRISGDWENHMALLIMAGLLPVLLLNWVALASVSMWLSLRVKRALTAPVLALLVVHLPPWIFLASLVAAIDYNGWRFGHGFTEAFFYYCATGLLIICNQLFWIRLSRGRILRDFRASATDRFQASTSRKWGGIFTRAKSPALVRLDQQPAGLK